MAPRIWDEPALGWGRPHLGLRLTPLACPSATKRYRGIPVGVRLQHMFTITVPATAPPLAPSGPAVGWNLAANAPLTWDVDHRGRAGEATVARIATDGRYIYVRFDATQSEPIAAAQHSNDVGQGNDDAVWIDLAPEGLRGYSYQFQATPNGTHYALSTENTSYSPNWESYGKIGSGGYTVTMKIPLTVIRGVHAGEWLVQFVRYVHATGAHFVWSYDAAQTNPDDFARAGHAVMPAAIVTSLRRPSPRVALYTLANATTPAYGGTTSRSGVDLSVPVTPTASFYATFHPDNSNVELDQQSISPTVYQRYYSEVRPFFTQAANFYDTFNCNNCVNESNLYTPAIPTPREGYALEGKQGYFGFAAFDSLSNARSDTASVLDYNSPDMRWSATIQHVGVAMPGLVDNSTATSVSYYDLKHVGLYADAGTDAGTNVLNGSQAQWYDAGADWASKTFGIYGAVRKVGEYYNPVDGFISHPGIAGYGLYAAKIFDFSGSSILESAGVSGFFSRYQGPSGGQAQSGNNLTFDVLSKSGIDLQLLSGSNYWRFGNVLEPISQNGGFSLTFHSGLQTNNPGSFPYHGSSTTPTQIQFYTGRYGLGRLNTWYRTSTMRAGDHGLLTLAIDDTDQSIPGGQRNVQWFDSLSYAYQISANSSLAVGLRRIIGYAPTPNGGGNCAGACSNISLAYHLRLNSNELYMSYGDPNTLSTVPQLLFKMIFYAGGQKGT